MRALIDAVGSVDAIVCAAGVAQFGSVEDLDDDAYRMSFENKLMGQVNLVRFLVSIRCGRVVRLH